MDFWVLGLSLDLEAIVNNAANEKVYMFLCSWDSYLGVDLLGQIVIIFLSFWKISYIPTNNEVLPFHHVLAIT